jgi:hypothetical protein
MVLCTLMTKETLKKSQPASESDRIEVAIGLLYGLLPEAAPMGSS